MRSFGTSLQLCETARMCWATQKLGTRIASARIRYSPSCILRLEIIPLLLSGRSSLLSVMSRTSQRQTRKLLE